MLAKVQAGTTKMTRRRRKDVDLEKVRSRGDKVRNCKHGHACGAYQPLGPKINAECPPLEGSLHGHGPHASKGRATNEKPQGLNR